MGKLLGVLIGFLILGPFGALFGFFIGSFIDSKFKITNKSFFSGLFNEYDADTLFFNAFPLLSAVVSRSGDVTKPIVLLVKSLAIEFFGVNKADLIMKKYKQFVRTGYSQTMVDEICEELFYYMDYQSKIYLLSMLFTILKRRGTFTVTEVRTIGSIADAIGITGYEFDLLLNRYRMSGRSNYQRHYEYRFDYGKQAEIDPYQVLEIDKAANNDEIKKQYRLLCKKYHPDLTSSLSENEKEETSKKMREVIDAYEKIKKARNMK